MRLYQYRTDGEIDDTPLHLSDVPASKLTALQFVANPEASGVYRVQFVDAEYDRVAFDTYTAHEIAVGTLMFAGASS